MSERGSGSVLVLSAVAGALLLAAGGAAAGQVAVAAARAGSAADAAALAGASAAALGEGACERAGQVAGAGRALLEECRVARGTVDVEVSVRPQGLAALVGPVSARARAGAVR